MRHAIVVDLGYGDAGKGGIVDWLTGPTGPAAASQSWRAFPASGRGPQAQPPPLVVRFNGGAQAGHTVVAPDGRQHTFAQFGAGTLHGAPTLLSRHVLVEPLALAAEAAALQRIGVSDPFALVGVDREALLTTPYHAAVNQARELARGAAPHGSCGIGIGETVAYARLARERAPRAEDCTNPRRLRNLLAELRDWAVATVEGFGLHAGRAGNHAAGTLPTVHDLADAYTAFANRVRLVDPAALTHLARTHQLVFEAAQGVLLDEWYGFHPHTTWSRTTAHNALDLLNHAGVDVADPDQVLRIGVVRGYTTRHGAGPMVGELTTAEAQTRRLLPEEHNRTGRWQGTFRVGHLDLVALRYAAQVSGGVDALAITHLDTVAAVNTVAPAALRPVQAWRSVDGHLLHRLPLPAGTPPVTDPRAEAGWLARQERLTGRAHTSTPVLGPTPGNWPAHISAELEIPLLVESHGPTWQDKRPAPQTTVVRPSPDQSSAAPATDAPIHSRNTGHARRGKLVSKV
jgi:adenylosuccinate synthase